MLTNTRVVFVIMLISSLAFYIMAFRVPVVSVYLSPWAEELRMGTLC